MLDALDKQQKLIIFGLILLIFSGLGVMTYRRAVPVESGEIVIMGKEQEDLACRQAGEKEEVRAKVLVHVSGAVKREGVYRLKLGERVLDAIEAAGGGQKEADLSKLNLAAKVKDGEQIVVPLKARLLGGSVAGENGKVNINTADANGLCKIPGVGKTTAKRIIDYRTKNGLFQKLEDIMKVKGIGKGTFEKIKDEIMI